MRPTARMILPQNFRALRADLGPFIKALRLGTIGNRARMKQEVLAIEIGITRTALSRIESGKAWPRSETLDRLIAALEIDWKYVAHQGENGRRSRRFDETPHGVQRLYLGEDLRAARRAVGLSLDELATRSQLSAAQISRIERGQCGRSRVFAIHPDDVDVHPDDQRIIFTDPALAELVQSGERGR